MLIKILSFISSEISDWKSALVYTPDMSVHTVVWVFLLSGTLMWWKKLPEKRPMKGFKFILILFLNININPKCIAKNRTMMAATIVNPASPSFYPRASIPVCGFSTPHFCALAILPTISTPFVTTNSTPPSPQHKDLELQKDPVPTCTKLHIYTRKHTFLQPNIQMRNLCTFMC